MSKWTTNSLGWGWITTVDDCDYDLIYWVDGRMEIRRFGQRGLSIESLPKNWGYA